MSLTTSNVERSAPAIAKSLLSRDPVQFNSTINSEFAADAVYKGHGLKVQGASGIKHVAFLFSSIDGGRHCALDEKSFHWDNEKRTLRFEAVRFLRPRLFPLFELALPVKTTLRFDHPHGADELTYKESKEETLLISSFEDEWYGERLINTLPLARPLASHLITPIASMAILMVANVFFAVASRFHSSTRTAYDSVRPAARSYAAKAEKTVPKKLKDPLNRGFNEGVTMAEGVGERVVSVLHGAVEKPVNVIEWTAQKSTSLINFVLPSALALPTPYVFTRSDDSYYIRSSKKRSAPSEEDGSRKRVAADKEGEAPQTMQEEIHPVSQQGEASSSAKAQEPAAAATVEIGASADGQYAAHSVSVPDAIASDATTEPAPLAKEPPKESLYEQVQAENASAAQPKQTSENKPANKKKGGKKGKKPA